MQDSPAPLGQRFCNSLLICRSADQAGLRRAIERAGISLKGPPRFEKDIAILKNQAKETLRYLAHNSEIPVGGTAIQVRRRATEALRSANELNSLVVVGRLGPGNRRRILCLDERLSNVRRRKSARNTRASRAAVGLREGASSAVSEKAPIYRGRVLVSIWFRRKVFRPDDRTIDVPVDLLKALRFSNLPTKPRLHLAPIPDLMESHHRVIKLARSSVKGIYGIAEIFLTLQIIDWQSFGTTRTFWCPRTRYSPALVATEDQKALDF